MSYSKGFGDASKMMEENAAAQAARSGAFDFFIKKGESAQLVFLDNEPGAVVYMYTHKVGDRFEDFICAGSPDEYKGFAKRPTLAAYFTVIQLGEFQGRNGKVVNPRRTLKVKPQTLDILKRQFAKRGGLRGCVFDVTRSNNDKSPAVGDGWDFEEKLSEDQIAKLNEDTSSIKFEETLKAKERTAEQLFKILQGQAEEAQKTSEAPDKSEVEW